MSTPLLPPSYPGWTTVRSIGNGSYGTVYEIQRDLYGDTEKAALKVISLPYNDSEIDYMRGSGMDDGSIQSSIHNQVKDIAREYKLMSQIRSCPNVVRCDDFMEFPHKDDPGWDIYIKMELLTPLLKRLDAVQQEKQIIKLGKDLCQALIMCQEKNIIHRDIKPQNIFIAEDGSFKLGDFGIARTMDKTTNAEITAGIGTYSYMAPEVFQGQPYGRTADIYSLGVVLYWCLNDRRGPFMPLPPAVLTGEDGEKAKKRRFSGEPLPPPKNGSALLKRIVLRACAYDPRDRYQSAALLLAALEALEQQPVILERSPKENLINSLQNEKLQHSKQQFLTAVQGNLYADGQKARSDDDTYRVRPAVNTPKPPPAPIRPAPAKSPVVPEPEQPDNRSKAFRMFAVIFLLAVLLCILLLIPKLLEMQEDSDTGDRAAAAAEDGSYITCQEMHFDQQELFFSSVGEQAELTVIMKPVDYTLTHGELIVEDPNVATAVFQDGVITVTATGSGETTVIMRCENYGAVCTVHCDLPSHTSPTSNATQQDEPAPKPPEKLTLQHTDLTLTSPGMTAILFPDNIPGTDIAWSSDNPNIAAVADGLVTAVGEGRTTIRASYQGQKATCTIRCIFPESNDSNTTDNYDPVVNGTGAVTE